MKPLKSFVRLEPGRRPSALIVAAILLSLCLLSLLNSRFVSTPLYGLPTSRSLTRRLHLFLLQLIIVVVVVVAARWPALGGKDPILTWELLGDDNGDSTYGDEDGAMARRREPICWGTSRRSNVCDARGHVRILGSSRTILLPRSATDREWAIKPYCRKHDPPAMKNVTEWTLKPLPGEGPSPPRCTARFAVPALVFSVGDYTDNLFHSFTDVLIPLFISAYGFRGEIQLVVADRKDWWLEKFVLILKQLSNYDLVDADGNEGVLCFPRAIVGLDFHKELGVNASKTSAGFSIVEFRDLLRRAYRLERRAVGEWAAAAAKPTLLIISRKGTRAFLNEEAMAETAARLGFQVRLAEATRSSDVGEFARLVNAADVMVGVHGAGLTNMVFLPAGAVLVQVVPLNGLAWLARDTFEKPAPAMGIKYLAYHIDEAESTLTEQYAKDDPVLKDPRSVHRKGWPAISKTYLENQDVRMNLTKFNNTLAEVLKLLPGGHGRKNTV
ncbi:hypothetical protein ZIOFF_063880 [Zingiber officinale]|uniref:Glycosyltransferase 61 catalytic domain-containing protein n=1 Tax=Zingiber officinale TaxID=94328 RepID=A0A8J5F2G4_ZINOF|nr:hypothetical protein ZIOFF_063880 [Zingiber officinale]